jgi:hypothetical protein
LTLPGDLARSSRRVPTSASKVPEKVREKPARSIPRAGLARPRSARPAIDAVDCAPPTSEGSCRAAVVSTVATADWASGREGLLPTSPLVGNHPEPFCPLAPDQPHLLPQPLPRGIAGTSPGASPLAGRGQASVRKWACHREQASQVRPRRGVPRVTESSTAPQAGGPCKCARGANFVRQCTARAAHRGCGTGSTHPRRSLARRWSHSTRTCRPSVPTECGVVSSRGSNRSCQPGGAERQWAASHVVKPPHSRSSNTWATHRRSILKTLASTRPQRPRSRAENRAEIA